MHYFIHYSLYFLQGETCSPLQSELVLSVHAGHDMHALLAAANMSLSAASSLTAPTLVTPFCMHDFLAGRQITSRQMISHANEHLGGVHGLLRPSTVHLKRKRDGESCAPPCAPVAFQLPSIHGRPALISDPFPLWQQLQQALALEDVETCDFTTVARLSL